MIGSRLPQERSPAHANSRSLGLRRPVAVRALSRHPPGARPRRAGSVADRPARAAVRRWLGRRTARPGRPRLLVSRARRILPAHARGRRHVARPRARARRHRVAERRRRGSHVRQDAQRGQAGRLHSRLRIRAARRRRRCRRPGPAAAVLAAARVAASGRIGARRLELAGGARQLHPLRAAPGARPVNRIAGACGGVAQHPVAAPQRSIARAARPRQVSAAYPGNGLRAHAAHRRRAGERQGRDEQDPRFARTAGAAARARTERHPGSARREAHRLSGRHQAVQRQSRPRHFHPADDRRGGRARV